jgi:hypothetical protein
MPGAAFSKLPADFSGWQINSVLNVAVYKLLANLFQKY